MPIGLWIALIIVCIITIGWIDYRGFIKDRKKAYEKFLTIDTPYGKVEYLDLGSKDDPVILFSTGGGAGIDCVLALDWITQSGYRVISVNRPGYYNLPLDVVDSIESHAKIYHEVIKTLGISEVNVFGVSMGGLSSLYYAQSYPVKSMVLWSAVTGEYHPNQEATNTPLGRLIMTDKGKNIISWMMLRSTQIFLKATVSSFLKAEADLSPSEIKQLADSIVKDKDAKENLVQFVKSLTPMSELFEGMMDEVKKSALPQSFNWNKINMPVFAAYSTIDKDVGDDHFERLKNNLVNGEFMSLKGAGHFVWWGPEGKAVIRKTIEFLDKTNYKYRGC